MTLYEIDERMAELIDPETGEIRDTDAFDALSMERDAKIENVALWEKNEKALAEALGAEIKKLQERKKFCEGRVERLKDYLLYATGGTKFSTPKVAVSFRNTTGTDIQDEGAVREWAEKEGHAEVLRIKPAEINKDAVKKLLNEGIKVPGAQLAENTSVIIK